MPRQRNRTEHRQAERENAERLGDDYRFTNDPELAAERRESRRRKRDEHLVRYQALHRDRWTNCMVDGCKFTVPKLLDFSEGIALPMCSVHMVVIWEHVNASLDDPDIYQSRQALKARRDAIRLAEDDVLQAEAELERQAKAQRRRNLDVQGELYYARVGGLIKVGWTGDLYERIRSYGADAELLAHYKGTRRDETDLHRQLAPSRAKGREWYHDDPIIRAFVSNVIRQYGEPRFTETRWTKPKQVVAGKRVMRSA